MTLVKQDQRALQPSDLRDQLETASESTTIDLESMDFKLPEYESLGLESLGSGTEQGPGRQLNEPQYQFVQVQVPQTTQQQGTTAPAGQGTGVFPPALDSKTVAGISTDQYEKQHLAVDVAFANIKTFDLNSLATDEERALVSHAKDIIDKVNEGKPGTYYDTVLLVREKKAGDPTSANPTGRVLRVLRINSSSNSQPSGLPDEIHVGPHNRLPGTPTFAFVPDSGTGRKFSKPDDPENSRDGVHGRFAITATYPYDRAKPTADRTARVAVLVNGLNGDIHGYTALGTRQRPDRHAQNVVLAKFDGTTPRITEARDSSNQVLPNVISVQVGRRANGQSYDPVMKQVDLAATLTPLLPQGFSVQSLQPFESTRGNIVAGQAPIHTSTGYGIPFEVTATKPMVDATTGAPVLDPKTQKQKVETKTFSGHFNVYARKAPTDYVMRGTSVRYTPGPRYIDSMEFGGKKIQIR